MGHYFCSTARRRFNCKEVVCRRDALFLQYVESNIDFFPYEVYGISAQGGKLPEQTTQLLGYFNPTERIYICGSACAKHDLTAPIHRLVC